MKESSCASCPFQDSDRICRSKDPAHARYPEGCPTVCRSETIEKSKAAYNSDPAVRQFALNAARQDGSCYLPGPNPRGPSPQAFKPRVQETAEFCLRMGYRKIGLAYCGAVHHEGATLQKILTAYGLDVVSVMCKNGGIPKEHLGITEEEKNCPGRYEVMCNPIGQAMILNEAGTEFNLVLGLCVGHDSLFMKYSDALCTVVAAKDRVLGHNPMSALWADNYKRYLLKGGK